MVLVVRRKLEFQDGDSQQSLQAFCFIEIFVVFCVFRFGVLFWFCVFIFLFLFFCFKRSFINDFWRLLLYLPWVDLIDAKTHQTLFKTEI